MMKNEKIELISNIISNFCKDNNLNSIDYDECASQILYEIEIIDMHDYYNANYIND